MIPDTYQTIKWKRQKNPELKAKAFKNLRQWSNLIVIKLNQTLKNPLIKFNIFADKGNKNDYTV